MKNLKSLLGKIWYIFLICLFVCVFTGIVLSLLQNMTEKIQASHCILYMKKYYPTYCLIVILRAKLGLIYCSRLSYFKGCVRYIFPRLLLNLSESSCQTRKSVFYFSSKALFVLKKIKF